MAIVLSQSWSFPGMGTHRDVYEPPAHMFSVRQNKAPCSLLLQLSYWKQVFFSVLFSATFFFFKFPFGRAISLLKICPKHTSEGLSSVPSLKKAVMCLRKKTHVLNKLL